MCISGFLLLLCVFANRISDSFGIPALLIFLGVGMLAGSDGLDLLDFHDAALSNHIGTIALSFILFTGGLETQWNKVKEVIARGSVLSTLGVVLTAIFLFVCTYFVLGIPFEISLLLSVIVSSTDAPAVFSILRSSKTKIRPHLQSILEFESGSNDPMAVLLSMGAITMLSSPHFKILEAGQMLLWQISMGIAAGIGAAKLSVCILKRWHLVYPGLYPVFGIGLVLITYSLTQLLKGNGFLAVYLCGIFLGNSAFMYRRHFIRFQDSLAWIMQILMFLILGLLVNPSELIGVMPISFACCLCLMFIARPLAVFICLSKSEFDNAEKTLISWAGFKGAVPIILATYPLMAGFKNAMFLFNLIFFMVIISVLFQGKTLPMLAKWLKLGDSEEKPRK